MFRRLLSGIGVRPTAAVEAPPELLYEIAGRILVASIPRCGSTFLVRSLAGLSPGPYFPTGSDFAFVRELSDLPKKKILKTHSPAPRYMPEDVRVIFLFGDPVAAVISTYRKRFDWNHFANCGYKGKDPPEIFQRDDLGYEKIFDSWMGVQEFPVLALRYETIWDHEHEIQDFVGYPVKLIPRRDRTVECEVALQRKLQITYRSLVEKVNRADNINYVGA